MKCAPPLTLPVIAQVFYNASELGHSDVRPFDVIHAVALEDTHVVACPSPRVPLSNSSAAVTAASDGHDGSSLIAVDDELIWNGKTAIVLAFECPQACSAPPCPMRASVREAGAGDRSSRGSCRAKARFAAGGESGAGHSEGLLDMCDAARPALSLCARRGDGKEPFNAETEGSAAEDAPPADGEQLQGHAAFADSEHADDDFEDQDFIVVLSPAQPSINRDAQPLLTPGHHYEVRWVSQGELGPIRIELHRRHMNGASAYWLISEGVPDDGIWDWFLPPGAFADGANYQLRLISTYRPNVVGDSGYFAIKSSQLIYVSWVLLMVAMIGTMCCTISVCKAIRQARMELRRAERAQLRGQGRGDGRGRRSGNEGEEGDGEEDEREEDDLEEGGEEDEDPVREWRPATPPEEQLAAVNISRFQCCICMEHAIDTVFVPCGHQVACGLCAHGCASCPICRAEIERIVKVYHK